MKRAKQFIREGIMKTLILDGSLAGDRIGGFSAATLHADLAQRYPKVGHAEATEGKTLPASTIGWS